MFRYNTRNYSTFPLKAHPAKPSAHTKQPPDHRAPGPRLWLCAEHRSPTPCKNELELQLVDYTARGAAAPDEQTVAEEQHCETANRDGEDKLAKERGEAGHHGLTRKRHRLSHGVGGNDGQSTHTAGRRAILGLYKSRLEPKWLRIYINIIILIF